MILTLTQIMQTVVELDDEQYAEFQQAVAEGWDNDFLDVYWSDMETVERTIEEG
jgi:hypothetical protein